MLNVAIMPIWRRVILTLVSLTIGISGTTVFSQQQPPPESAKGSHLPQHTSKPRPKIGLALEGGGALGFAHIGVLEWFEEHHIPVDYIAGTSMGGLVGGLYATGMSTREIKELVNHIEWPMVLSGQVQFQDLSYRRKQDRLAFPNRLEFGLKHGFSLPSGLNSGAAVGLLFDRVTLPYWNLKNFDELPTPFRCVATEITTGQKHVFEDGSLSQALRATMSIAGVFAPVRHGSGIYSDGMAVDNLPVDVARSMGSDVVIASYLDSGPPETSALTSLLGIAGRNVSIMVAANEVQSLKNADVVISSDVSKYGTLEFSRSSEIIPIGKEAAASVAEKLEQYSLDEADWDEYLREREARRRTKVPIPQFIEVYGLTGANEEEVHQAFEKFVGESVDPDKIEKSVNDLRGTSLYSTINYTIVERDGKPGLLIRPRLKDYAPPFLNLGATILTDDASNVQLGLQARATFFHVAGPGSELRITGAIGQIAGGSGELFKRIPPAPHFFVAPRAYFIQQLNGYYQGSTQLEQYKERRGGFGADFGYQFNNKAELRAGEDYQWFSQNRTIGTPAEQEFHLTPWISSLRFQYLGQNDVMVPTQGSIVRTVYQYFTQRPNESGGYSQMTGQLSHFFPVEQRGVIFGVGSGGTSFGADNLGLAGLTLGGPLRLSAYGENELLGTDYFLGQAGYLYRIIRLNPVFGGSIYGGGMYEIGKMYGGNPETPSLPNDFAALVIVKTIVGPLFGGFSVGDSGHRKWYFGLGRVF
jgi:NTE family protein